MPDQVSGLPERPKDDRERLPGLFEPGQVRARSPSSVSPSGRLSKFTI